MIFQQKCWRLIENKHTVSLRLQSQYRQNHTKRQQHRVEENKDQDSLVTSVIRYVFIMFFSLLRLERGKRENYRKEEKEKK